MKEFWTKLVSLRLSQNAVLLIMQLVGFLALLVGVSLWSVPAAIILGGLVVIAVVEFQSGSPKKAEADDKAIKETIDRLLKEGKNPFDGTVPVSQKWVAYAQLASRKP